MVGTLISQCNPDLIQLIAHTAKIFQISSASDMLYTLILNDVPFRDWFLCANAKRLGRAFEFAADWCVFHGLP